MYFLTYTCSDNRYRVDIYGRNVSINSNIVADFVIYGVFVLRGVQNLNSN